VGVIVEERDELYCLDCGEPVADEAIARRAKTLLSRLSRPFDWEEMLASARTGSLTVSLPGACVACGGGRIAPRMGSD
jgi:hypothetical protein